MSGSLSSLRLSAVSDFRPLIPAHVLLKLRRDACNLNVAGPMKGIPMQINILTPADAGFALIVAHREERTTLTKRSAQFAGQLVANDDKLSEAQARWLGQLGKRAGFDAAFLGGE